MAANPVIARLGRRLRLGIVGGGGNALIGPVHRTAATMDGLCAIEASVLSSDPERSLTQAAALGIPRPYADLASMLAGEKARPDGIDAVLIVTPNDSHAAIAEAVLDAGLHVACDKPLTNDFGSATRLAAKVAERDLVFLLTHNYSGYPMVREARARVAAGNLGRLHLAEVRYFQGGLATRIEDRPDALPPRTRWRLDPERGGASHVMMDIGSHAHQLLTFITGQQVASVMAELGAVIPGRSAHDTGLVLLRMANGGRAMLAASKAAAGAENMMAIEVYGPKGGLAWEQSDCNRLRAMQPDQPAQMLSRGWSGLSPLAKRATRLPTGHPEGFQEGFANLYADFAEQVSARIAGVAPDPLACHTPTAADGARGLAFIDACMRSTAEGRWVDCVRVP
jgi:predicted dehydrogenase